MEIKDGMNIDAKSIAKNQQRIVDLMDKLTGTSSDEVELRKAIERAATPEDLDRILNKLSISGESSTGDYAKALRKEFAAISKSFDLDSQNKKFTDLIKELAKSRESEDKTDDSVTDASEFLKFVKKEGTSKGKDKKNVSITNKKDVDISLEYLEAASTGDAGTQVAADIKQFYTIENGQMETKDDFDPLAFADAINSGLGDRLVAQQKELEEQQKQANVAARSLFQASKTGGDDAKLAYKAAQKKQDDIAKALEGVKKGIDDVSKFSKQNADTVDKKKSSGAVNQSSKNLEDLDKAAERTKTSFDILGQGTKSFQESLNAVEGTARHLQTAFAGAGSEMKGLSSASDYAGKASNLFSNNLLSIAGIVGFFGAAMALAGKAIGDYHDQLNIAKGMGGGDDMVKSLQGMHINSLMDPKALKDLSDSVSSNFNVSLTENQHEMERIATKSRLSERVMGKEYAEGQMAAISELKDVLDGQTPSGMMDDLAAQTSALAKTMGISNKMALEQIKAIHQNTKMITKGMNKDIAKRIEAGMQSMAAGMKEAGFSEDYIKETLAFASQSAADDDQANSSMMNLINVMQHGGAGAEMMTKGLADMGMSAKQATDLQSKRLLVGFDGLSSKEKEQYLQVEKLNKQAQESTYAELSKKADENNISAEDRNRLLMISQDKNWQRNSETANRTHDIGVQGVLDAEKRGKAQHAILKDGANAQKDVDKLLVTMGAKDEVSRKEMLEKLKQQVQLTSEEQKKMDAGKKGLMVAKAGSLNIKGAENMSPEALAAALKKEGVTDQEMAQMDTDAWTSAVGPRLQKEVADMEKKGTGSFGGVSGEALKATVSDKDYENKRVAANSTAVQNTGDDIERLSVKAQYAAQNAIMGAVNKSLEYFNTAIKWLTENIMLVAGIIGGVFLAKLIMAAKGPLSTFAGGLMSAANLVGEASWKVTETIGKGMMSLPGLMSKAFGGAGDLFGSIKDKISNFSLKDVKDNLTNFVSTFGERMSGFKDKIANFSLKDVKDSISSFATNFGEKVSGMKSSISTAFSNFKAGAAATPATPGVPGTPAVSGFFSSLGQGFTSLKDIAGKGISGLGGAMKGLMGPAALAGAAMAAFQGAMEGWGKANQWFKHDLEKMPAFTADAMKGLKGADLEKFKADAIAAGAALDANGNLMVKNGQIVNKYGESIERQASLSQKMASGLGGALESLSFGLLDGRDMANATVGAFEWLGNAMKDVGITGVFTEIGEVFKAVGKIIFEIGKAVFSVLSPVFEMFAGFISGMAKYIKGFMQIAVGIFTLDGAKIVEGLKSIMSGFFDIISAPFRLAFGYFDKVFGTNILGIFKDTVSAVSNVFGGIIDVFTAPFKAIMGWIRGDFTLWEAIKSVWTSVVGGVKNIFSGIIDVVTSPFKMAIDIIGNVLGGVVRVITAPFRWALGLVGSILSGLYDLITSPFKAGVSGITGILGTIFDVITTPFRLVVSGISSIVSTVYDLVTSPFKAGVDGITGILGTIFGIITAPFTAVIEGVKTILGGYLDIITAPFKALIGWFNGEFTLLQAFNYIWTTVVDGVKTIFGGFFDIVTAPFKKAIEWIKSLNPFGGGDDSAKKASEEVEKKHGFTRSLGSSDELTSKKVAEKAKGMSNAEIKTLVDGGNIDSDNADQLKKILAEREGKGSAPAPTTPVPQASPAPTESTRKHRKSIDEMAKEQFAQGKDSTGAPIQSSTPPTEKRKLSKEEVEQIAKASYGASDPEAFKKAIAAAETAPAPTARGVPPVGLTEEKKMASLMQPIVPLPGTPTESAKNPMDVNAAMQMANRGIGGSTLNLEKLLKKVSLDTQEILEDILDAVEKAGTGKGGGGTNETDDERSERRRKRKAEREASYDGTIAEQPLATVPTTGSQYVPGVAKQTDSAAKALPTTPAASTTSSSSPTASIPAATKPAAQTPASIPPSNGTKPATPVAGATALQSQQGVDAYAATQAAIDKGVKYGFGSKDASKGSIDCSGWIASVNCSLMDSITDEIGNPVYEKDAKKLFQTDAAGIIKNVTGATGKSIEGADAIQSQLKPGMLIGENNSTRTDRKGTDNGKYKGIDHITQAVQDPVTGKMMISESASDGKGGGGVKLTDPEAYFARARKVGKTLTATDPTLLAKGVPAATTPPGTSIAGATAGAAATPAALGTASSSPAASIPTATNAAAVTPAAGRDERKALMQKKVKPFDSKVENAIMTAVDKTGVSEQYMRSMAMIESGGNANAVSSTGAKGLYQFVDKTGAGYGLNSKDGGKSFDNRFDPEANALAAAKLAKDNKAMLKGRGVEGTDFNTYMAHQQGAGGWANILDASKGEREVTKEMRKNMDVNGGKGKTPEEFVAYMKDLYGKKVSDAGYQLDKTTGNIVGPGVAPATGTKPTVPGTQPPAQAAQLGNTTKAAPDQAAKTPASKTPATQTPAVTPPTKDEELTRSTKIRDNLLKRAEDAKKNGDVAGAKVAEDLAAQHGANIEKLKAGGAKVIPPSATDAAKAGSDKNVGGPVKAAMDPIKAAEEKKKKESEYTELSKKVTAGTATEDEKKRADTLKAELAPPKPTDQQNSASYQLKAMEEQLAAAKSVGDDFTAGQLESHLAKAKKSVAGILPPPEVPKPVDPNFVGPPLPPGMADKGAPPAPLSPVGQMVKDMNGLMKTNVPGFGANTGGEPYDFKGLMGNMMPKEASDMFDKAKSDIYGAGTQSPMSMLSGSTPTGVGGFSMGGLMPNPFSALSGIPNPMDILSDMSMPNPMSMLSGIPNPVSAITDIATAQSGGMSRAVGIGMPTTSGSIPSAAMSVPGGFTSAPSTTTVNNTSTTAQQTPGGTGASVEGLLSQILAENQKQSSYLGITSREASNQTRQSEKDYKQVTDRADNTRQHDITMKSANISVS